MKDTLDKTTGSHRKPYVPPRLTRYGDLRTLTQGGFRAVTEGEEGMGVGPKSRAMAG